MRKKSGLIWILLGVSVFLNAQVKNSWHTAVAGFEYYELIKGAGTSQLPLLIAFHYSSSNPEETIADYDSLKTAVRIIIPRGNYKKRSGYSYFPAAYYQEDSLTQLALLRQTIDSLAVFVDLMSKKFNTKALLSGISQGGDIALSLAVYYPRFAKLHFLVQDTCIHNLIIRSYRDVLIKHLFICSRVRTILLWPFPTQGWPLKSWGTS